MPDKRTVKELSYTGSRSKQSRCSIESRHRNTIGADRFCAMEKEKHSCLTITITLAMTMQCLSTEVFCYCEILLYNNIICIYDISMTIPIQQYRRSQCWRFHRFLSRLRRQLLNPETSLTEQSLILRKQFKHRTYLHYMVRW